MNELENYRIQLQQVEAALIAEPDNEELLKLKDDLNEIIELQQELIGGIPGSTNTKEKDGPTQSSSSLSALPRTERFVWKVGDRCMAPTKSGQKHLAVIDGISQDKVAITFATSGKKDMVRLQELSVVTEAEKKKFIYQSGKQNMPKKEWHLEKERRKQRAQKKEQRRKQIEDQKELEKSKWKSFNVKANTKNMKGLKHISVTGSAADGPGSGKPSEANKIGSLDISSRRNTQAFGATQRGNMESLF